MYAHTHTHAVKIVSTGIVNKINKTTEAVTACNHKKGKTNKKKTKMKRKQIITNM